MKHGFIVLARSLRLGEPGTDAVDGEEASGGRTMTNAWLWISPVLSAGIVCGYELHVARAARRDPAATARTAHSMLRGEWVRALSKQPGSELLAVQALRNSLMSATITASTAAVVLMGSANLLVSHHEASSAGRPPTLGIVLDAALALALFAAFACSATAMRYYHHAGFAMSLPVGSPSRSAREPLAVTYVQRGGTLYSWSLRCFFYAAPVSVGLFSLFLMPFAAVVLAMVLNVFDGAPRRVDE